MTDKTTRAILITPSIVDDFKDPIALALWIYILCKANVTATPYEYRLPNGQVIALQQGQMFLNLKGWAVRSGITYRIARARFEVIKKITEVVTKNVIKQGTIITVTNLSQYQTFDNYKNKMSSKKSLKKSSNTSPKMSTNHTDTITQNNHTEKPAAKKAPPWACEMAKRIKNHVEANFNKAIKETQLAKWAADIDKLTRSTKFVTKPKQREVFEVINWGLQDNEVAGTWTGWAQQIQSPPNADKFIKIQASMKAGAQVTKEATPKGWTSA